MAKEKSNTTESGSETEETTSPVPNIDDISVDNVVVEGSVRPHFFRPAVICGACEHCGTARYIGGKVVQKVDKNTGDIEHRLVDGHWETLDATKCPHYKPLYDKGLTIRCSYCQEQFTAARNSLGQFQELLGSRIVYIMSFTNEPNKLIMYCDSFECRQKHIERMRNTR